MNPERPEARRGGVLKVFWPAILGWGSLVVALVVGRLGLAPDGSIFWFVLRGVMLLSWLGAAIVCGFVREARNVLALLVNFSLLLLFIFAPVMLHALRW